MTSLVPSISPLYRYVVVLAVLILIPLVLPFLAAWARGAVPGPPSSLEISLSLRSVRPGPLPGSFLADLRLGLARGLVQTYKPHVYVGGLGWAGVWRGWVGRWVDR